MLLAANGIRRLQPADDFIVEITHCLYADPVDVRTRRDGFNLVEARAGNATVEPEPDLEPAHGGLGAGITHACHEGHAVMVRDDDIRAERLDDFAESVEQNTDVGRLALECI